MMSALMIMARASASFMRHPPDSELMGAFFITSVKPMLPNT
jgi:hypothetical protein